MRDDGPLHEDPDLPGDLRAAFAHYRDLGPTPDAGRALLTGIESRAAKPLRWTKPAIYLGIAFLIGGLSFVLPRQGEAPKPARREERSAPSLPTAASDVVAPPPPVVPETLPALPGAKAVVPRRKPQRQAPALDIAGELQLLARAKRALVVQPVQALALTAEHRARFPQGALGEEREVIAIEALARSGRLPEASARAAEFRAAHPRSTHLERLDVVLTQP